MSKRLNGKDELLIKYLYDEMTESEGADLEEELIRDEELDQRLHVVEMDLIDCFLREEMSPEERTRFETGFLASLENQLKVENAQLFHRSLQRLQNETSVPQLPVKSLTWKLNQVPRALLASAAVVLLMFGVLAIWLIPKLPYDSSQVGKAPSFQPTPAPAGQSQNKPSQSDVKPNIVITPTPESYARSNSAQNNAKRPRQEEWLAAPEGSGLMGGPVQIKLLPNHDTLRLKVALLEDTQKQKTFRVTIKDDESEIESVTVHPTQVNYNGQMIKIIFVDARVAKLTDRKSYEFAIAGRGSIRFVIER